MGSLLYDEAGGILACGYPITKPFYEALSAHLACWSRWDKSWFPPSRLGLTLRFRAAEGKAFGDQVGKSGCRPGQRMGIPGPRVLPLAGGKWGVRLAETGLPPALPSILPCGGGAGQVSLPTASPQHLSFKTNQALSPHSLVAYTPGVLELPGTLEAQRGSETCSRAEWRPELRPGAQQLPTFLWPLLDLG